LLKEIILSLNFSDFLEEIQRRMPNKFDSKFGMAAKFLSFGYYLKEETKNYKLEKSKKTYSKSMDSFLFSFLEEDFDNVLKSTNELTMNYHGKRPYVFVNFANVGKYFYLANESKSSERYSYASFYLSEDFNYKYLGDLLYKKYGNKIFIDKNYIMMKESSLTKYEFSSIKLDDKIIEFAANKKANKYLKLPGTYLFYGEPGTGKSSFVFGDSIKDKKVIGLTASTFCDMKYESILNLFKILNPDILLIEEFDKVSLKLDTILVLLERLRQENKTVILTANSVQGFNPAVLRPKRIDKIIKFDLPNHEEIKQIISLYSSKPEFNDKLFNLLKDCELSHAYIVDLSKKLNDDFSEIEGYVCFLKEILNKGKDEDD
jgi:hypothetical protein